MSDFSIVTDSLASLPPNLIERYDLKVAPQVLIWGEDEFLDGVDITPAQFYARLKTDDVMPTTSQATLASFKAIYESLVPRGVPILTIVGSSELTATINSAQQAKALFPEATIEIIDSKGVAMSLGFQVLAAARAREQGKSFQEAVDIARRAKDHTGVLFVVETLEYLHRGGRIGGAARLFGTVVNLKPLLELRDGRVESVERIRTKAKAYARLAEVIVDRLADKEQIRLATLHADAEEDAQALMREVQNQLQVVETVHEELTPVIGTHAGPGTVGLAYSFGM
ncbi:MAG: DegV family EDD domain-containing protein [Anaerolineales bacterium]|nr:DegV family EDD domain-containing protein [Anaerolineales bacterium]